MAAANVFTAGQIRKLEAIIGNRNMLERLEPTDWIPRAEFATDLLSKLPTSHDLSSNDVLLSDLNHHISSASALTEKRAVPPTEIAEGLRDIGRRLWNECIKERRKKDDILSSSSRVQLQARARVLAFLAHALARETRNCKEKGFVEDVTSMMDLSLTLARVCVESSDLDGALLSMTKAADYIERLKITENTTAEDHEQMQRIEAEYFAMRCALSWKQGCLDVAEHMYAKADNLLQHVDSSSAERLADTFHCIGGELSSKEDHDMALKWLRRALNLINAKGLERLSTEGLELRMSIHHELIQTLLATGSEEHFEEADNLASQVESEIGDKPIVLHWKLEIIHRLPGELFDADACASILRRMIRSFSLSDPGLGFLLHGIGELRTRGPRLAVGLMEELIIRKLIPCGNLDWIGKAVVRRVWMGTMETDTSTGVKDLVRLLDQLIQETYSAYAAFNTMPKDIQDEPLTRYLMFKVALMSWNHELGRQCIEYLGKMPDKSQCRDIIYACVRDAQNAGDRMMTLETLKAATETFDMEGASTSNLPSLFRCAIRLVHLIETPQDEDADGVPELAEDTCCMFERAAEHAKLDPKDEEGAKIFTVPELHWFRKNAYNIACYPPDISSDDVSSIRLMTARCHFVIAAALISQARTEDEVDERLQRYLEVRYHISVFDTFFTDHVRNNPKSGIYPDLLVKMSTLFVFDFESAVCLKQWDDSSEIVRKATICKDEIMYKAMADCLLRSEAPGNVVYGTMRLIINEIYLLEGFDNERLAKYIRCLFKAILPLDDRLALQVIEQAVKVAREGSQVQTPFPADDLDYIVAATFNHAIDISGRGDEGLCQQWALKALELAEYMDDGGDMRDSLRERAAEMGLSKGTVL
uniref:Protein ZIP4 homolog n=1 Tax=Gibberella zeae TaxID=5518 RepID=A0A4E9DZ94_GIBZA